jgi:uncharacterized protein (DUF885 family)
MYRMTDYPLKILTYVTVSIAACFKAMQAEANMEEIIMRRLPMRRIVTALLLGVAAPAVAAPADDLKAVISDHWSWWLSENPISATSLGVRDYDDKLPDISLAAQDKSAAAAQKLLDRLNAIPEDGLTETERANKGVLARNLSEQIEANRFDQRMMLFTTYESPYQSFAGLGDNLPMFTGRDYRSYLTRLGQFPKMNAEIISITRQAVAKEYVQPCAAMGQFEKTVDGAVAGAADDTRFYGPFKRNKPADVSEADWAQMKAEAVRLIRDVLTPEYHAFSKFYLTEYQPKCSKRVGASYLPDGKAYYAFRARTHTTTNLTPEQIHQIGLNEVTRILARMDAVAKSAGYPDRQAMIAKLRTDPQYYATTPEQLMQAAARQAKLIDGKLPQYFGKLPRLTYGLREIPKEIAETTTTAYYNGGSLTAGIAGFYYVNTSKLNQRPIYELPALTAHESVPGHHFQGALQQEIDLPDFRKHASWFTAYGEGWGLYSEYLGEEMGLYDTPEKMMGRLSYEMWRACRLVVDTGMHAKGWTKDQAIRFMTENSALSAANIEAEVNRYISWPGQALGYKIGEIKLRELRGRAETKLGAKFDLRRFHDIVLAQGAVPLDVLEAAVDRWITQEAAK